jgi:hypothetical protein
MNRTGLGFSYQQDRVEIPITGLTPPHIVSVPVPGFPTSCIAVNLCSVNKEVHYHGNNIMEKNLNSDGLQFYQYQQNKLSPYILTSTGQGWDSVIKRAGLRSGYQQDRVGIQLSTGQG